MILKNGNHHFKRKLHYLEDILWIYLYFNIPKKKEYPPLIEFIPDENTDTIEIKKQGRGLKLSNDGTFGSLQIDPSKLLQIRLEAYNNNGKKVINRRIDDAFICLLTKRYNPKKI